MPKRIHEILINYLKNANFVEHPEGLHYTFGDLNGRFFVAQPYKDMIKFSIELPQYDRHFLRAVDISFVPSVGNDSVLSKEILKRQDKAFTKYDLGFWGSGRTFTELDYADLSGILPERIIGVICYVAAANIETAANLIPDSIPVLNVYLNERLQEFEEEWILQRTYLNLNEYGRSRGFNV